MLILQTFFLPSRPRKKRNVWEGLFPETDNKEPVFISRIKPCRRLTPKEQLDLQTGWLYHTPDPSKCINLSRSCPDSIPGYGSKNHSVVQHKKPIIRSRNGTPKNGRRPYVPQHMMRFERPHTAHVISRDVTKTIAEENIEITPRKRHSISHTESDVTEGYNVTTPRITISR